MARPVLIIGGHDYAAYVAALTPSLNDLDADGSGRDVTDGRMYRRRIATKRKWDVQLLRLSEALLRQLCADISPVFYEATTLDPATGEETTRRYYTSSLPVGAQRYNRSTGECYYDGVSFSMTEE